MIDGKIDKSSLIHFFMSEIIAKKTKKFHPILFAIFPILIIYSQNIGRVSFDQLFLPLTLVILITIGTYYFFRVIVKNGNKAAIIVTIILITIFAYGHIYILLSDISSEGFDISRNRYLIPIFGISLGIGIFLVKRIKTELNNATSILNVVSIVLILVAISNSVIISIDGANCDEKNMIDITCSDKDFFNERNDFSQYFDKHEYHISDGKKPPDVYYIILDEYSRNDVLEEYHNFANDEFTDFLEQHGFHVAKQSFANYPLSMQSIPSLMNMRYLDFLPEEIGEEVRSYKPLNEKSYGLLPNNQVMKNFKDMGYKIINFNTFSLHKHEFDLADMNICHREVHILNNRLLDSTLRTTIFGYFIERWDEDERRNVVRCTFNELPNLKENFQDEPIFVLAHLMLPHPPWIFGPNGENVTPGKPLLITDNPEYRDSKEISKIQYLQQVEFANKKTIEFVNEILDQNEQPIIIIQGDHGSAWDVDWLEPSQDDVYQRLTNFDAIYFPDEENRIELKDDRTLVNTFRIIFNSYFSSNYEILENKLYWAWIGKPYYYEEVTDLIESRK